MQDKKCYKCLQLLPESRYSKDKTKSDGLCVVCKECTKQYKKEYWNKYKDRLLQERRDTRKEDYKRNYEYYKNYRCTEKVRTNKRLYRLAKKIKAVRLLHPDHKCQCIYCNETNIYCLDFHHENPKEKETTWNLLGQKPWIDIKNEIIKCIPVCRNCHSKIHNSIDFYESNKNKIEDIIKLLEDGELTPPSNDLDHINDNADTNACSLSSAPAPNIDDSNLQVSSDLESSAQRVDLM